MTGRARIAALVGGAVVACGLVVFFVWTGLDAADKIASVTGLFVGVVGLLASMYGLVLARRTEPVPPAPPVPMPSPNVPLPDVLLTSAPAGLSRLPRPPARAFVGRERELGLLAGESGVAVVRGLGGIGKSELALQYAHRHRDDHTLIWWVDAATPARIRTELADITRTLVPAAFRVTDDEACGWALSWLAARRGWLLVLDDVAEPADVEPYLGRLTAGRILITTRRHTGWERSAALVNLDVLPRAAAVAMLRGSVDGESVDDEDLDGLAEQVGDLPLALAQAEAYISRTPGVDMRRYRELLRSAPDRMYALSPLGSGERVVARVWTVSHEAIAATDELAISLLDLLACFAPDDIPVEVLLRHPGASDLEVAESLGHLASYSLINVVGDSVAVHRLVQAVTRQSLEPQRLATVMATAVALLEQALPAQPDQPESWPRFARMVPHVLALLPPESPGLPRTVGYLAAAGDYATAITLQQRVLERADGLDERADLARLLGKGGDAAGARETYAELLPRCVQRHGERDPRTLGVLASLAEWTGEAGDRQRARELYETLIPELEQVLGVRDPITIYAKLDHANWVLHLGEPGRAHALWVELLPTARSVWGAQHPETLTLLGCLAYATGRTGDAAGARDQYAQLLAQREQLTGPDHPETLATARDLAEWTGEAGDPADARDRLARLIPRFEHAWGPEHPNETLQARSLHARFTGLAGDAREARDLLAALLPIRERTSGADHPLTRATRDDLAHWTEAAGS
jgi:tetratricopeptide (TPR) repeat protein